jgi:DNA-binding NtrC family response regulator
MPVPVTHRSVLLVDDEQLILELYASALRLRGFAVHLASDATTARAISDRARPDVICIDGRMINAASASSSGNLARQLIDEGAKVVIFTNDQALYDHPPAGVAGRLIKVNTRPHELADRLLQILEGDPDGGVRDRRLPGASELAGL